VAGTFTLDEGHRDGPWDALIGSTAGSFRIVRLLGKGGMGSVYLARHPGIGAQVAVKFLHPRFAGDRNAVERFFNEARAVNLIGHENIVKTLDFAVTADGRYYFVMEHLSGQPLSALLQKPVPLSVAGPILLQCCRALQAAHERQIVHRDLKPDNVFLISQMGKKNFVKLVDFGIAKLADPERGAGLTEAGALIGTPEYMSPEQAAGRSSEVGRRSDVYSLGVVMYQLAAGRVPFGGSSTAETLVAQMQEKPAPPRSVEPSVPEAYEKIILKALEKKKDDRWQSMAELHDAILGCMKELGLSAELPAADPEPLPQTPAQMPETDPKQPEGVPLTGTFAGDRAPVQARVERFADWAFAPPRRLRTLGVLLAGVVALVLLVPRRQRIVPPPGAPLPAKRAPAPNTGPQASGLGPRVPLQQVAAKAESAPTPSKPPAKPKPKPHPKVVNETSAKPVIENKPAATPPPAEERNAPTTAADAARLAASTRKEREAAKSARAEMLAAAAEAAREDAAKSSPPAGVKLFIVSDPLGASVTAAWSGKSAAGTTPIVFRVRRGAAITVSFSKPGYAPQVREIAAREAQAVAVELRPIP
jgi:serine/threonine-protein kinase